MSKCFHGIHAVCHCCYMLKYLYAFPYYKFALTPICLCPNSERGRNGKSVHQSLLSLHSGLRHRKIRKLKIKYKYFPHPNPHPNPNSNPNPLKRFQMQSSLNHTKFLLILWNKLANQNHRFLPARLSYHIWQCRLFPIYHMLHLLSCYY